MTVRGQLRSGSKGRTPPPGDLVRDAIREANGACCGCGLLATHCPVHQPTKESA